MTSEASEPPNDASVTSEEASEPPNNASVPTNDDTSVPPHDTSVPPHDTSGPPADTSAKPDEAPGMDRGGPSRTARAAAFGRAYHQIADRPLILADPVVAPLLGVTPVELANAPEPTEDFPGSGAAFRPRRLFFAARARFAEDRIAAAVADGARQAVILGAGLDTFAYRNPHPGLRVFEVDHPATQAWKRDRLAGAGIEQPESLSFVPVDFETDTLSAQLASSGFDRAEPAVFVWLGVVFYLTPPAVRATLAYVAGQAAPSEVIVDYLRPAEDAEGQQQLREREARVAAAGEPWFSYFTPTGIGAELESLGLTAVEDLSGAELIDRYNGATEFRERTPRVLRPSRILRARNRTVDDSPYDAGSSQETEMRTGH